MMHKAWSIIEEVPYCFSRSSVKFQGHIALKIVEFDPNWAFPDCNSSLNSPMAMKCCTKLETAKKRCPIVFQGHPSNFKVTWDKTSPILTQIGRFRTIGRSQLSNPSDLPCFVFVCRFERVKSICLDQGKWKCKVLESTQKYLIEKTTVRCHYNKVQYDMILHISLRWLRQNINQGLHSQEAPHISPSRANYGM